MSSAKTWSFSTPRSGEFGVIGWQVTPGRFEKNKKHQQQQQQVQVLTIPSVRSINSIPVCKLSQRHDISQPKLLDLLFHTRIRARPDNGCITTSRSRGPRVMNMWRHGLTTLTTRRTGSKGCGTSSVPCPFLRNFGW